MLINAAGRFINKPGQEQISIPKDLVDLLSPQNCVSKNPTGTSQDVRTSYGGVV